MVVHHERDAEHFEGDLLGIEVVDAGRPSTAPRERHAPTAARGLDPDAVDINQRIRREEEPVCPVCIATVALMVTGAASIGGLAALAVKQLHARADARELEPTIQCKGEQDGHINAEQTRSSESSIPS